MANPKGRPKVKNKYAWVVTPDGVQAVPVRMHQGVYKTFNYDSKTQKTTFYKEVKSPVFENLEEANKNAPKFIGYQEDVRGLQGKGDEMFYDAKYGYEINADNEFTISKKNDPTETKYSCEIKSDTTGWYTGGVPTDSPQKDYYYEVNTEVLANRYKDLPNECKNANKPYINASSTLIKEIKFQ